MKELLAGHRRHAARTGEFLNVHPVQRQRRRDLLNNAGPILANNFPHKGTEKL